MDGTIGPRSENSADEAVWAAYRLRKNSRRWRWMLLSLVVGVCGTWALFVLDAKGQREASVSWSYTLASRAYAPFYPYPTLSGAWGERPDSPITVILFRSELSKTDRAFQHLFYETLFDVGPAAIFLDLFFVEETDASFEDRNTGAGDLIAALSRLERSAGPIQASPAVISAISPELGLPAAEAVFASRLTLGTKSPACPYGELHPAVAAPQRSARPAGYSVQAPDEHVHNIPHAPLFAAPLQVAPISWSGALHNYPLKYADRRTWPNEDLARETSCPINDRIIPSLYAARLAPALKLFLQYCADKERFGACFWRESARRDPRLADDRDVARMLSSVTRAVDAAPGGRLIIGWKSGPPKEYGPGGALSASERCSTPVGPKPLLAAIPDSILSVFGWRQLGDRRTAERIEDRQSPKPCPLFPEITPEEFLASSAADDLVRNRIILIGYKDATDIVETPDHGETEGVYVHAMALDNLFAYGPDFFRAPGRLLAISHAQILAIGLMCVMLIAGSFFDGAREKLRDARETLRNEKRTSHRDELLKRHRWKRVGVIAAAALPGLLLPIGSLFFLFHVARWGPASWPTFIVAPVFASSLLRLVKPSFLETVWELLMPVATADEATPPSTPQSSGAERSAPTSSLFLRRTRIRYALTGINRRKDLP